MDNKLELISNWNFVPSKALEHSYPDPHERPTAVLYFSSSSFIICIILGRRQKPSEECELSLFQFLLTDENLFGKDKLFLF